MSFSLARLLVDSDFTPPAARRALRTAFAKPPEQRGPHLEAAARALRRELDLDWRDAFELVGLAAP